MTTISKAGNKPSNVIMGRIVSPEQIDMDNAAVDRCRKSNYGVAYKYNPNTLPYCFDVTRFCDYDKSGKEEVAILQNAVRCLRAMWFGVEDVSILDEYVDDTLLTFDYATGKTLFDEETFKKDLNEYKNKQKALIAEYNKIAASTTLLNAIENAKKLQQIKDKIAELQVSQPKEDDAKYNHPEIVEGNISVKQALDRYKELHELYNKYKQEWEQHIIDYKRSRAKKLNISDDTFRIFKDLYNDGIFVTGTTERLNAAVARYESVEDYNENNWKEVAAPDARDEGRKFLTQKQLKLWRKYGDYVNQSHSPLVVDWMMYDHFNDNDLMWLNALKAFNERVIALKRIEEQHTDECDQSK